MPRKGNWTKWDEPATKGEVVAAMVWTQALVARLAALVTADVYKPEDRKRAFEEYQREFDAHAEKADQIGGWVPEND